LPAESRSLSDQHDLSLTPSRAFFRLRQLRDLLAKGDAPRSGDRLAVWLRNRGEDDRGRMAWPMFRSSNFCIETVGPYETTMSPD